MKDRLPPSVSKNLAGLDEKAFLGKLAKNRALKLLGISGVALFSIGALYSYIEKNGTTL